jgi:hypothetical protein
VNTVTAAAEIATTAAISARGLRKSLAKTDLHN